MSAAEERNGTCRNGGHLWIEENLYTVPETGWKTCRLCREEALQRGARGEAHPKGATHCRRGHEYTPENTLHETGSKHRTCRECRRASWRRKNARKAARIQAATERETNHHNAARRLATA